jgi:hypothetical protein
VGANPVHLIVNPFAFSVEISFYSEGRELIGDDAKGPSGRVRRGTIVSESNNLGRGSVFIPLAEGAESACGSMLLYCKIRGPSAPLCGDDHPSSMNGIFSQFGHRGFFPEESPG